MRFLWHNNASLFSSLNILFLTLLIGELAVMQIPQLIAILLVATALLSVINEKFIKMPLSIGVMVITMVASLLILLAGYWDWFHADHFVHQLVKRIDFSETLMHGMLSSMLFAGALHTNLTKLWQQKWAIFFLAIFGTFISTALVGYGIYYLFNGLGLVELPLLYCLLFGALISPTDPIAVLAIMRRVGAPADLEILISGESLFNDGVGVVLFAVIGAMILGESQTPVITGAVLFAEEMVGGILFGLLLGWVGNWLLEQVYDYHMDALITLAVSFGGYQMALVLGVSGLIAVVVAGLMAGQYMRKYYPADELGRTPLDIFWKIIDELLNAILFVLIGLELMSFATISVPVLAMSVVILVVLVARWVSVLIPIGFLKLCRHPFPRHVMGFMTWGGLRGGLPIALVLSLPQSEARETMILLTYAVVAFSIIIQGLSISPLMRFWMRNEKLPAISPSTRD
ncbi:cation:proton antiporter [Ostreibacterium oceani]|uniref:Sodium:proton antiporter n=1 Tax=Ostreibacterium oceani TaxID=2654998 RepID=A0A6N7EXC9_9GAMM|nr:sodium:proton antiporter [Ostreibacterium oceani]MPV86200.1 sodium:proton antiporter [Ostreibacterium oceani]